MSGHKIYKILKKNRGSFFTVSDLMKKTGVSESSVRQNLNRLTFFKQIKTRKNTRERIYYYEE